MLRDAVDPVILWMDSKNCVVSVDIMFLKIPLNLCILIILWLQIVSWRLGASDGSRHQMHPSLYFEVVKFSLNFCVYEIWWKNTPWIFKEFSDDISLVHHSLWSFLLCITYTCRFRPQASFAISQPKFMKLI